jgi:hypothetical protein
MTIDTTDAIDMTPGLPALPPIPAIGKTGVPFVDNIITRVLGAGGGSGTLEENAAETAASVTEPLGISGYEDYFIRGVVIILGFIFVAVGLSMFKGSSSNG